MTKTRSEENTRVPCGVLALVVPTLALHRFILGDVAGGIVRILLNIALGLGSLISFVEGIIYLVKSDEEFYEIYQVRNRAWF